MPFALTAATAHEWATERSISLWVVYASDLPRPAAEELGRSLAGVRADGCRIAVVDSSGDSAAAMGLCPADLLVAGPPAPSPFGVFDALRAAHVDDVRRVGVVGCSSAAIQAGHRAGAGAIVALSAPGPAARARLLEAQPDCIVEPSAFGSLDADRFSSRRSHRQRVLLNPGPAVVSDRVHRAVGGPDLCHREPEYSQMLGRVRAKLLALAGVGNDWAMVMLAGSGTSAMEAMTSASTRPGRKLLVCRNGIYGERIETIARRSGIEVVVVDAPDLEPIDAGRVVLALDADNTIDAVAVIHHETTTGLVNPVHEIAAAARKRGVRALVDAISSFGAEELQLADSGIDFLACTSNKCLHGLPGAAFVLVSPLGQERINAVPPRSLYFDLGAYLRAQEKGSVPYTPAIPAIYGLEAALDELMDEGLSTRQAYYKERIEYLDRELGRLGLAPRVAREHRSRSVRSLPLPPGIEYDALHDAVKQEGYVIYGGLGEAARTSFRVCALGALKIEALQGFVTALERALAGRPDRETAGVVHNAG